MANSDSPEYQRKREFYDRVITLYGRKPVLEALQDDSLLLHKLHLSSKNRPQKILDDIQNLATQRQIEICEHSAAELSRISRNGKQDQGVALDVQCPEHIGLESYLKSENWNRTTRILALDRITNPQNLGMIIRSAAAGNIDAVLLPKRGCAALSPLVIKASAGTLFRCPLIRCDQLEASLYELQKWSFEVAVLSGESSDSLLRHQQSSPTIYVLGNETEGVSREIKKMANHKLTIPMQRGVESLNVAITAALIAFIPG